MWSLASCSVVCWWLEQEEELYPTLSPPLNAHREMAHHRRLATIGRGLRSSAVAEIVDTDACIAMGNTIPPGPKGRGTVETVGDMDMYVVGKGPRAIVLVYDIMGFAPANTQHNCDVLAQAGFLVVMPDFFRGSGRGQEGFERPDSDVVDAELANVVLPFVKEKGGETIGLVGFCFGGGVAARAASTGLLACVGGIHASGLTPELAAETKVPMMMLQAGNDPDLAPVVEVLKDTDVYDKCVMRQVRRPRVHLPRCALMEPSPAASEHRSLPALDPPR